MNYFTITENILKNIDINNKPTLLLHSCCAPCSTRAIEYLANYFDITVLYYNPNIYPEEEYIKRKNEQIKLCKVLNIKIEDINYDNKTFEDLVVNLQNEKEGGKRCEKCFYLRLQKTHNVAKKKGFNYFTTTLTVSPHKNSFIINEIGNSLQDEVKYLPCDLKKQNGYLRSIQLSKEYELYRQNYCGCKYSLHK